MEGLSAARRLRVGRSGGGMVKSGMFSKSKRKFPLSSSSTPPSIWPSSMSDGLCQRQSRRIPNSWIDRGGCANRRIRRGHRDGVDAPARDVAYKLTEYKGRPRMNTSQQKFSLPGRASRCFVRWTKTEFSQIRRS